MIAEPADQLRLLDLQALDSKLSQLAHRRRTLPQLAEAAALDTRLSQLRDVLVACAADESDLAREQAKAEADVDQVRARAARDRKILDAGAAAPKELSGLQSELESLARRQNDLEDVVLDVMERTESAVARSAGLKEQQAAAQAERDRIGAALGTEQSGIDKDVEFAAQQRAVDRPADPGRPARALREDPRPVRRRRRGRDQAAPLRRLPARTRRGGAELDQGRRAGRPAAARHLSAHHRAHGRIRTLARGAHADRRGRRRLPGQPRRRVVRRRRPGRRDRHTAGRGRRGDRPGDRQRRPSTTA